MKTIDLQSRSGPDGMLHLDIPVEDADHNYRVTVVIEPVNGTAGSTVDAWPDGFFEATCGQWKGEFEIDSEGGFEDRAPL
jgi:hypothetical protein